MTQRSIALAACIVILGLYLSAVALFAGRPMHYDENEYLHASWMMAAGKRLYVDFFEDHPPHLFQLLNVIRPGGDLYAVDVRAWAQRARWLAGLCGMAAGIAVMLFAWRATRSPAAAVVAGAVVFSGAQMWTRGLADVRAEAPTLALFWVGALLVAWSGEVTSASAIRHGVGLGLIVIADAWNPKWPIASIVVGIAFLHFVVRAFRRQARAALVSLGIAAGFAVVAIAPILAAASLRDYVFFNFTLKSKVYAAFETFDWMLLHFRKYPFASTMDAHVRPWMMIAALVFVAAALAIPRVRAQFDLRASLIGIGLLVAALLEIRFVYPYPLLWAQYLVMAVCGAAVVYAMVPAVIEALVPRSRGLISMAALVLALAGASYKLVKLDRAAIAGAPRWDVYWARLQHIRDNTRPGETVWISPPRHPVAVMDASYYWYSFREAVPYAIKYASATADSPLPPVRRADLPPCRLATNTRFIELSSWINYLDACACAEQLAGRVVPSPHFGIFEVPRDGAKPPTTPRWFAESASVWPHLCQTRGFAGTDAEFEFRARQTLK